MPLVELPVSQEKPNQGKKVTVYIPKNNTTDETAKSNPRRRRKSSRGHSSRRSLYEAPDAETEKLIQAAISDPRNSIKNYWNDRDSDSDEGLYEDGPDPKMYRSEKTEKERGGSEFDRDEDDENTPGYNDDGEDNEEGSGDENGYNDNNGEDDEYDDPEHGYDLSDNDDSHHEEDVDLGDGESQRPMGEPLWGQFPGGDEDSEQPVGNRLREDEDESDDIPPRPSSSIGFTNDDDDRVHRIEDFDDDDEVHVLPPRLSSSNSFNDDDDEKAKKHFPGKRNLSGSDSQSRKDPNNQEKSQEGPPRPPRPRLAQPTRTEIPSSGQESLVGIPKDISKAFVTYRIKEFRPGGNKDGVHVSYKREKMRRHYTHSKLNASTSADEVDNVAENDHGIPLAQPEAKVSPISPDGEQSSTRRTSPVSPPYPNGQKAFEDFSRVFVDTNQHSNSHFSGDDSEAGAVHVEDRAKHVQPPPRPQSAPPLSQPEARSSWSDDSDSSEEDEEREERVRREREAFETVKNLWSRSLRSEYLKVSKQDPAKNRRAVRRLRDARAELQEVLISKWPKLDIFDLARFDESIPRMKVSLQEQIAEYGEYSNKELWLMNWILEEWKKDQTGMRNSWKRERNEWESTKKAWKKERQAWEVERKNERMSLYQLIKETDQKYKRIIKEQKEEIERLEEDNHKHIDQMERFPESKLSLVFGEPTATSPISPLLPGAIVCNGGPGWAAPDAIDIYVPEGVAIVSPNSPIMPLQTPKEAWSDKAFAPPWFPKVPPENKMARKRQGPGFMELTSPSHPDPFSDFGQRCHCCGNDSGTCTCNCRREAGSSSNADRQEIKELKKRNSQLMKIVVSLEEAEEYGKTLEGVREHDEHKESQRLIKAAADLVDKVQVELIARQVEIRTIRGALGMSVDDVTIRLSDVSAKFVRDPVTDWEAEEQRAMVRRDLLEDFYGFTGLQLLDSDSDSDTGARGPV